MLRMQPARRQNRNRVDVLAGQEIVDVVTGRNEVFRCNRVRARADRIVLTQGASQALDRESASKDNYLELALIGGSH